MRRKSLSILLVVMAVFLAMNAAQAIKCHAGSVSGKTSVLSIAAGSMETAALSSQATHGDSAGNGEMAGVRGNAEENRDSQASRTGRTIMTLFLITLVVVGLSIYPILMINRAAKTLREQMKKEKEEGSKESTEQGS